MIRFILLQNRAGKTRLAKYYVPVSDSDKRKLEYDVHRLIVGRDPKHTNFVEVRAALHRGCALRRCRKPAQPAAPAAAPVAGADLCVQLAAAATPRACASRAPCALRKGGRCYARRLCRSRLQVLRLHSPLSTLQSLCIAPPVQDLQGRLPALRRPLLLHRCAAVLAAGALPAAGAQQRRPLVFAATHT